MTSLDFPGNGYARAAGLLLIASILAGIFGEMYVPSRMIAGDVASTADRLLENEALFRLGFAAYLVEAFSDIVLAWLFYVILRPVHRDLALLSALFGVVSMTLFAVTKMFYFAAPTFLAANPDLAAFSPEQREAFASLFLSLYVGLNGLFNLFYGSAWLVRGWLTCRADYLPTVLGLVMILAGLGFVAKNITLVLAPAYSSDFLVLPMLINAVLVAAWLLVMGLKGPKGRRAIAA